MKVEWVQKKKPVRGENREDSFDIETGNGEDKYRRIHTRNE